MATTPRRERRRAPRIARPEILQRWAQERLQPYYKRPRPPVARPLSSVGRLSQGRPLLALSGTPVHPDHPGRFGERGRHRVRPRLAADRWRAAEPLTGQPWAGRPVSRGGSARSSPGASGGGEAEGVALPARGTTRSCGAGRPRLVPARSSRAGARGSSGCRTVGSSTGRSMCDLATEPVWSTIHRARVRASTSRAGCRG